jgi:4-amino-4-deoxy-L-arabinose transferase-like glycosyltransferase
VGAVALYLGALGATDLWAPDEPRYAHVAAELFAMERGAEDLVLLRVNGEPYDQKPPLYFWLAALASAPAGEVTEWTARLPTALAGLATLAVVFAWGRRLFDSRVAAWAAALLATVFDFAFLARRARLDVMLTLFTLLALAACWRILVEGDQRRRTVAGLHLALGLATLTKGPVAFLVLLAALVFVLWERRPRDFVRLVPAWGWLLSLGLPAAWIAGAVALGPEGFFDEAVVRNTVGRFAGGVSKVEPWYFFLYQFPANFLPWTLLWPLLFLELRRRARLPVEEREQEPAWRFLVCVVGTWLVFFTLSDGKRGLYLLPCFPAAALLCAAALEGWLARRASLGALARRGLAAGLAVIAALGAFVLVVAGDPVPRAGEVVWPGAFGAALLTIALAAAAATRALARGGARRAAPLAVALAAVAAVELAVFALLLPAFEPEKSPRPIAEAAAARVPEGEAIGLFGHTAMLGGLNFYGHRRVALHRDVAGLRAYLEGGGRVIATRARHLDRLGELGPVEEVARFRSGRRAYVLLAPAPLSDASARRGP